MHNINKKTEIFVKSDSQCIEGFSTLIDGELRYIVIDSETGEVYDNAHGDGYATAEDAVSTYNRLRSDVMG